MKHRRLGPKIYLNHQMLGKLQSYLSLVRRTGEVTWTGETPVTWQTREWLLVSKEKQLIIFCQKWKDFSPGWFVVFEVSYENHLTQSRLDPGTVVLSSLQIH